MALKVKKYRITNKLIAKMFGYASANSFNSSSAKDRICKGVDQVVKYIENKMIERLNE